MNVEKACINEKMNFLTPSKDFTLDNFNIVLEKDILSGQMDEAIIYGLG